MKKLLILGGARSQVPAIIKAKELGYYVITCDYLPDNIGHKYSDQYENISTIDHEKILEFSEREYIDGIIAYASDPSAPSAAYVCSKLGLAGSTYDVVEMLCKKDLFRIFQKEQGFMVPWFYSFKSLYEYEREQCNILVPCVVKPVDSSGSKGVSVVRKKEFLEEAVNKAFAFSRCKRVIVEEYIPTPYFQLHGDGVVEDGKLKFVALGDQRFKNSVPIGSSLPSQIDKGIMEKVINEISSFIQKSGFICGGINIEVRVTDKSEIYIIEIGPRTGGNYIPQLMEVATGFDEMTSTLKLAMGEKGNFYFPKDINCCFQYIVGSKKNGIFKEVFIDEYMQKKVVKKYIHKQEGDFIEDYENSNGVVGVIILKFQNHIEMEDDIKKIEEHIRVILQEKN